MVDPMPVRSAWGHVETFEEFAGRERARLDAGGAYPVPEAHSRAMLKRYEEKDVEWKRALERAEADAKGSPPPLG